MISQPYVTVAVSPVSMSDAAAVAVNVELGDTTPVSLDTESVAVGAVLFQAGKYVMAFYLSTAAVVSAYGAAGSLVVILMWIYFSSAVLLLSASVARVWNDEACARQAKAAAALASEAHAASAKNDL